MYSCTVTKLVLVLRATTIAPWPLMYSRDAGGGGRALLESRAWKSSEGRE